MEKTKPLKFRMYHYKLGKEIPTYSDNINRSQYCIEIVVMTDDNHKIHFLIRTNVADLQFFGN